MICDSQTTAAFTGHRTYDRSVDFALSETIGRLYSRGYRLFLSGMAVGFDLAAAEAVLTLRIQHPDIRLGCIVPFEGQADHFSARDLERYERVLQAADEVVCLAEAYFPACYAFRNDFLVDNSSLLVAFYDGSEGGTRYTVRRAEKSGHEVINLWPDPQLSLPGF